MNKQQEWVVYTILTANLVAVSKLGMETVGSWEWKGAFWVSSVAVLFALSIMMSLAYGYEPIAKHAFKDKEEFEEYKHE